MPLIAYRPPAFKPDTLAVIEQAVEICADYRRQGYDLTLRQLYYQFVSRDLIPNNDRSYKRLGSIVSDGRLAGLIDWDYIVDRGRNLYGTPHRDDPGQTIRIASYTHRLDKWEGQPNRVEVWVEKEALASVISRAASSRDVDYLACKGYMSQSEMWAAGQRYLGYARAGQSVTVLHLGDHDPSGIDMTRDICDRLGEFTRGEVDLTVRRIALTRAQVDQYQPPPNPAKITDSRAVDYVRRHGDESWELDALAPPVLVALINQHIDGLNDSAHYARRSSLEQEHRDLLTLAADRWDSVVDHLQEDNWCTPSSENWWSSCWTAGSCPAGPTRTTPVSTYMSRRTWSCRSGSSATCRAGSDCSCPPGPGVRSWGVPPPCGRVVYW